MPAVRGIIRDAKRNDYRMSSFVLGVINSPAFRLSAGGAMAADAVP
jgi:hypothetical protein